MIEITRRTLVRAAAGAGVAALAGCHGSPAPAPAATLGLRFPAGFGWGAATSAYQIEGAAHEDGRGESIWDTFSHTPGRIVDGSTGDVACDHYHRWAGDLDLLKSLGIRGYRFSISWPRVMPAGRGGVNAKGLDFYRRLVAGLHDRGIAPVVTLFHWDLPQALQDQGGWENRDCAGWFADYASALFTALGDAVPTWLTINEPKTVVQNGYLYGSMAPGKRDQAAAALATHHLMLAHGRAVQAFRAAGTPGRIGPAFNLAPVYPSDPGNADAVRAARATDGQENRVWMDSVFTGAYPADVLGQLPEEVRRLLQAAIHEGDMKVIGSPVDVLGVNYYTPVFVDAGAQIVTVKPTSVASWEQIYPTGLYDLLTRVKRDYGDIPLLITENGIPDDTDLTTRGGTVQDPQRVDYLREHLKAAHQAIAAGVRLEGYHLWSLLDNFEWAQGYTQRWGIVHVDFASQARTPKASAHWYRDVIARNGI